MSQSEFLEITCNSLKTRENRAYKVRLDLVVFLLVEKLVRDFSPITSVAVAIA